MGRINRALSQKRTIPQLRWLTISLIAVLLLGCHTRPPLPAPVEIPSDSDTPLGYTFKFQSYDDLQAMVWTTYGKGLYYCAKEHPPLSFEREVCARQHAVDAYNAESKGFSYEHKSLREMAKTSHAGFLREYTWYYLNRPYWVNPKNLALGKFETWKRMGLPGHEPNKEPGIFLTKDQQLTTHTSTLADIQKETNKTLSYPNEINQFKFTGITKFYNSELGERVRYRGKHKTKMEGFVYPAPTDYKHLSSPSFVRGVFSNEKAAILKLEESNTYHEVKVLYEGSIKNIINIPFQQGIYSLRKGLYREYRFIYMSAYQGQLIKIIFNQPVGHHFDGPLDFHDDAFAFLMWAKTKIDFQIDANAKLQAPAPIDSSVAISKPMLH